MYTNHFGNTFANNRFPLPSRLSANAVVVSGGNMLFFGLPCIGKTWYASTQY